MNIACIDIGTSRSKAAVYDENLRQSAFVDAPTRRIFPDGTIALDSLAADAVDLVQRLPEMERRSVDVLVFTTVFGHVFLDRQGEPVGPGLAWNYRCCENAVREAEDYVSRSGEFVGRPMSPELLAPRLLAMRSAEPERLRQIVRVFGIKDYLLREFTGVSTTDYSQVDYAAFTESLREELAVGSLLPVAGPAHCIAAYLKADIARRTGLRTGLPVVLGSSDGTSAMYGAGVLACGQIATVCGSTDVAMATISDREISPNRLKKHQLSMNRAMIDGYALVGGSTGASGMISTWWRKRIGATSDRIWEDVLPGAEGISVVPSFGVERAPFYKGRGGAVVGLDLEHDGAAVERAVNESVAFRLNLLLEKIAVELRQVDGIIMGGGNSSMELQKIRASVAPAPLRCLDDRELSLRGAAMFAVAALAGADVSRSAAYADRVLRDLASTTLESTHGVPGDPEVNKTYQKLYHRWCNLVQPYLELSEKEYS